MRRGFRPGLYSGTSSELISETDIAIKGKRKKQLNVNFDRLNEILSDLRHHAHEKIASLSGSLNKKFGEFQRLVTVLHETNTYPLLVNIVNGHFENLEEVTPGTIGAYCYGRTFKTEFDNDDVCSSIAAGAMPTMQSQTQACSYPTVLAEYNRTGYSFTPLRSYVNKDQDTERSGEKSESEYNTQNKERSGEHSKEKNGKRSKEQSGERSKEQSGERSKERNGEQSESEYNTQNNNQSEYETMTDNKTDNKLDDSKHSDNKRVGFVFVPHKNLDEFMGFSLSEKKKLKELGIDHVRLYGYNEHGKHYNLTSMHIDEIKCRKRHTKQRHVSKESSVDSSLGIVLIVLIIILFIGGFLLSNKWRYGRL